MIGFRKLRNILRISSWLGARRWTRHGELQYSQPDCITIVIQHIYRTGSQLLGYLKYRNYQTNQKRKSKIITTLGGIYIYIYDHDTMADAWKTLELVEGSRVLIIGVTNAWIIELGRILSKITKSKTFQIRPFLKINKKTFIGFIPINIWSQTHTKKYAPLSGSLSVLDSKVPELSSRSIG